MKTDIPTHFQRVLAQLKKDGFLLETDPKLPSVCGAITGGPSKGSWWSHPLAQAIFQVNELLEDHKDVLIAKLVAGKVTFIHRKLWSEILSIGTSRESWQLKKLSTSALTLLQLIDERGSLTTDEIPPQALGKAKVGVVARELETKLLINGAQIHTASGAHAKALETWVFWAARVGFENPGLPVADAKKKLEKLMSKLNQQFAASAKLPWQ